MENNGEIFLLDAVTLSRLSAQEIKSVFVRANCVVIEEIGYEARDYPNREDLQPLVLEIDISVLRLCTELLKEDYIQNLIKLYDNKGNGDVIILAKAIVEIDNASGELFPRKWIIVTDDKNLCIAAKIRNVETLSTVGFKKLIKL